MVPDGDKSKGLTRFRRFAREYTAGLRASDVRRLFGKDAQRVYDVMARDQKAGPEPPGRLSKLWWRARLLFFGVSYKLNPARRMLFALAVMAAIGGFMRVDARMEQGTTAITIGFLRGFYVVSIVCLLFLLCLELVDRVLVRDELDVARQLQRDLLPGEAPTIPGYSLAFSYRTATEIGGDYFDFVGLPDGRIALLSGDASGHGIAAGLLMAIAKTTIATALDIDPSPMRVIEIVNRALHRSGSRRDFMTLFYGLLSPGDGKLEYVCAAHPFPLLRRARGSIEELGQGGLPLGIRPRVELASSSAALDPGDTLLLYTDGLVESIGTGGHAFGFERLRTLAELGGDPRTLHDRIMASFDAYVGTEPLSDDVSLVIVQRAA